MDRNQVEGVGLRAEVAENEMIGGSEKLGERKKLINSSLF